jgi:DNA polymerase-2
MPTLSCSLLTVSYRDQNGRFEITLHAATEEGVPLVATIDTFRPLFFVARDTPAERTVACAERKAVELCSMEGTPVDCLYFVTQAAARDAAQALRQAGVRIYESDVSPISRFLMERQVRGGFTVEGEVTRRGNALVAHNPRVRGCDSNVALRVLSLDIETDGLGGEIYCIACCGRTDRVYMNGDATGAVDTTACRDERDLLRRFAAHVQEEDPDILIGWNVIDFDLRVLVERAQLAGTPLAIGRNGVARVWEAERGPSRLNVRVPGRVVLDVPTMLRASNYTFDEYSLDFVASALLGRHKLIEVGGQAKVEEIRRLHRDDRPSLARYNLEDARLTRAVFEKAGLLANLRERARLCGHLLDRTGGSVAAFDYLYLPRLHRAGHVAGDVADVPQPDSPLTGGYVMDPKSGIYQNVVVFDFRSLYPSIIMTFLIDPLALASRASGRLIGPVGTSFAKDEALLPAIIAELMAARAEARTTGNAPLSQAIKILMNSFYGVLGTPSCRFFSATLAQTITATGQYLFRETASYIERTTGFRVIYGDTDSLFVLLGAGQEHDAAAIGKELAGRTTEWLTQEMKSRFGARSALALQFECHFRHFLIPSVRGGGEGSKKHYCGSIVEDDGTLRLIFKGMESARTDWTDLAKEFQHELCQRIFAGTAVDHYIVSTVAKLRAGELDALLIYRKRLRKGLDEYTDHVPPHAQAARLMDSGERLIKYFVTTQGPQPLGNHTAPIDYEHYVEAQLRPIADTLLELVGQSFERIVSGQQELFA